MNIAQAKSIRLRDLLQRMGLTPDKETDRDLYYLSPWRQENTASFHVNIRKNVWYDHGEGIGGDVLNFACTFLEKSHQSCQVSDGLTWIKQVCGGMVVPSRIDYDDHSQDAPTVNPLQLKNIGAIKHVALVRYLDKRVIPLSVAKQILQEVSVFNIRTYKTFAALALENDDGGYELRNPFFKGCISPKTITLVRGRDDDPEFVNIFEGFMDYLSVIVRQDGKPLNGHSFILNSLTCLKEVYPLIKNGSYEKVFTWFDNDAAGLKAKDAMDEFVQSKAGLVHQPLNGLYFGYKDVNEWHVATPMP